jgi:hypothetical protein
MGTTTEGDVASATGRVAARTMADGGCSPTSHPPSPARGSGGAFLLLRARAPLERPPRLRSNGPAQLASSCDALVVKGVVPRVVASSGGHARQRRPCPWGRRVSVVAKAAGAHGRLLDLEQEKKDVDIRCGWC